MGNGACAMAGEHLLKAGPEVSLGKRRLEQAIAWRGKEREVGCHF